MKKQGILCLLLFFCASVQGKTLQASFAYASFDKPGVSPYLETYLNIAGHSVVLKANENGMMQAKVEVQWIYTRNDSIIHFDKYFMLSPEYQNSTDAVTDFIDLQRVTLPNGQYEVELKLSDANSEERQVSVKQSFTINFPEDKIAISEIELLQSFEKASTENKFVKSGYMMVPYGQNFFPKEITSLRFYAESYRTDKMPDQEHLVRYFISNSDNNQMIEDLVVQRKFNSAEVNVIMGELPIENLPSGNYHINIEIRNKSNQIVAYRSQFFQRSNVITRPMVNNEITSVNVNNTFVAGITNSDSLVDYIACLYPISTMLEVQIAENQMNLNDVHSMQQYIYHFWSKRNPQNPELAWKEYKAKVETVNSLYSTRIKKGYDTERGRVQLQYGEPNHKAVSSFETTAYPYEIWHYYKLGNQSNRKFVFYTTDLSANDYKLLHSDAIGETEEPSWELILHSRTQQYGSDMDYTVPFDSYGSKTKENFDSPK